MRAILASLLATLPPLLLYVLALPWLCLRIDRRFGLVWRLPPWVEPIAWTALLVGILLASWTFLVMTISGRGTPNPLFPTRRLVESGPFRWSRNPMMIGGWLFGAALAALLRSASLLAAVGVIVVAGSIYVHVAEEPGLIARFGDSYREYAKRTPRWLAVRPRT